MQLPILIEKLKQGVFRARELCPVNPDQVLSATGKTREAAAKNLKTKIQRSLPAGAELHSLEIKSSQEIHSPSEAAAATQKTSAADEDNPWLKVKGIFKDDPLFDQWRQAMADYRQQVEDDPNAR